MSANKLTIARVKALANKIDAPVAVAAGRPITAADHGKVLAIASALTVTLPQDTLPPGFRCWFVAPASGNLSVDPLGSVTLNGAGTTLTRARAANPVTVELYVPAANTALIGGA